MKYQIDQIFKFLSCKTKRHIIMHLYTCDCDDCSVDCLCKFSNSKQSNVSKHLIDLKKENIVDFKKKGKIIQYYLNNEFILNYQTLLNFILEKDSIKDKCCCSI